MPFFIFLLILVTFIRTQSELDNIAQCAMKSDCLSCSILPNCYWRDNDCIYSDYEFEFPWYTKLSSCLYNNYELQRNSDTYCAPLKIKQIPFNARLLNNILTDNIPQVFCKWTIDQFPSTKKYKLDYQNKYYLINHFAFEITSASGLEEQTLEYKYSVSKEGIDKFKVYYYAEKINKTTLNYFSFVIKEELALPYFAIFLIILAVFTIILCGLCIILWKSKYAQKIKKEAETKQLNQRESLIAQLLQQIQYKTVKKTNMTICMICLEQFTNDAIVCQFDCKHIYHYTCIKKWIETDVPNATCPNCKKLLFENYQHFFQSNNFNDNHDAVGNENLPSATNIIDNNQNRINNIRVNSDFHRIRTIELISNRRTNNYLSNNINIHSTTNYNSNINLNLNTEPNSNGHRYYTSNHQVIFIRRNLRNS